MFKKSGSGIKIALGAVVAGVAGFVTGILTAPKSGKQTREELKEKIEDVKEGSVEQLENGYNELTDLLKGAKDKTIALSSKAREEFNEAVVTAKDAKDKAGTVLKSFKSGEADDPALNKAIKQVQQAKKNLGKYLKS